MGDSVSPGNSDPGNSHPCSFCLVPEHRWCVRRDQGDAEGKTKYGRKRLSTEIKAKEVLAAG